LKKSVEDARGQETEKRGRNSWEPRVKELKGCTSDPCEGTRASERIEGKNGGGGDRKVGGPLSKCRTKRNKAAPRCENELCVDHDEGMKMWVSSLGGRGGSDCGEGRGNWQRFSTIKIDRGFSSESGKGKKTWLEYWVEGKKNRIKKMEGVVNNRPCVEIKGSTQLLG